MESHTPVLKNEIVETFSYLRKGDIFVDGTLGAGGHSLAIARNFQIPNSKFQIVGIDKDASAIKIAKSNFKKFKLEDNLITIHDDFKNIENILSENNIGMIDGALIDMGVSSMQLDDKSRGFSFMDPAAPIDMRMDRQQKFCANDIVNHYGEERLAQLIYKYGEERFGKSVARNIVKNRPLNNMGELIESIKAAIPAKSRFSSSKHFATRTLQAIRIEVNNELQNVENTIESFVNHLRPGAKLAMITFHSLEDKIVKDKFRELAKNCICPPKAPICVCNHRAKVEIITRNPIVPSDNEVRENPRSRSAKIRIVERL